MNDLAKVMFEASGESEGEFRAKIQQSIRLARAVYRLEGDRHAALRKVAGDVLRFLEDLDLEVP